MQWAKQKQSGFTIVELLIVVVVIAILATITIVAYNGIQNRARDSQAQSTVSQAMKQIKAFAVTNNETYPTSITSCPNPNATQLCINGGSGVAINYVVDNTVAQGAFCASVTTGSSQFYADEAGRVLPGSCAQQSCYQIQQAGGSHGSGTYWITPTGVSQPVRAYCDMDTSDGGWTLLVNNPGPSNTWNATNVTNLNANNPSLSSPYSMLQYANEIKTNVSSKMNYRMDAVELGRWGGVWEAPYSANLEGTAVQNVATLVTKYNNPAWNQDTDPTDSNGTGTPSNVVPWVSSVAGSPGLTTWGGVSSWYGTIVTYNSWAPAPWMTTNPNPGVIRYWVR